MLAAGVVVFRPGRRVLLVHRPRYDDWSFPKGKLDRGEHPTAAAVREVAEETGLHVRLCLPLPDQHYPVSGRPKTVHYWTGRVVGDDDVSGYRANEEIDGVRWVDLDEAETLLTYERDRVTLGQAVGRRRRTRPMVLLRHGQARSRRAWRRPEEERPLLRSGERQAERLVPVLAAYDLTRVVTSPYQRCVQTVAPYVHTTGWSLDPRKRLDEEHVSARPLARLVEELVGVVGEGHGVLVCTHRPVLPMVFDALGVEDPRLEPGELVVVHLRKGTVAGTERHLHG